MTVNFSKQSLVLLSLLVTAGLSLTAAVCNAEDTEAPAADPREALRQSGVSSFTKGALSNIVIRGYQRENLMITIDGAPYFGATPFRVDAPPFLLNNIEVNNITVTKGPYNLAVPGGLGGTVEITTSDIPRKFSTKTTVSYTSYDAVDGSATVGIGNQTAGASAGYRGRYSAVPEAGDGIPLTNLRYPNDKNNYRPGSDELAMYRIDTFWLKGELRPTDSTLLNLSYTFLHGTDIKVPTLNFDVTDEQIHQLNGRVVVRNISALIREISLQGWWSRARTLLDDSLRESSDPTNSSLPYRAFLTRSYNMANRFEVDSVGSKAIARLALGAGELKSGIDFYQRNWNGTYSSLLNYGTTLAPDFQYNDTHNTTLMPDVTTRNVGLFGVYERPLTNTLRSVLAVRGDISRVDADGLVPGRVANFYQPYYPGTSIPYGRDFTDWSANAQLFWQVHPTVELFVKGGRAIRIPDGHELYVEQNRQGTNLIGNPFLRQTVLHQVDTGVNWAADGHCAGLTVFYGTATDFILPTALPDPDGPSPLMPARSTTNLNATIWGVEFDGTAALTADLALKVMIAYSEGENNSSGRPLAEIPPLRGHLGLQYDDRRFFGGISQRLVARQNRFDPTLNETSMPGYCVTDLNLGGRYKGAVVTVKINNLFDVRYVQPLSYQRDPLTAAVRIPEYGRNITLTASYRF